MKKLTHTLIFLSLILQGAVAYSDESPKFQGKSYDKNSFFIKTLMLGNECVVIHEARTEICFVDEDPDFHTYIVRSDLICKDRTCTLIEYPDRFEITNPDGTTTVVVDKQLLIKDFILPMAEILICEILLPDSCNIDESDSDTVEESNSAKKNNSDDKTKESDENKTDTVEPDIIEDKIDTFPFLLLYISNPKTLS